MDVIFGVVLSFIMLVGSVYRGIFVGYPLIISLVVFIFIVKRRGHAFGEIFKMAYKGSKKSFIILRIFLLIGAITALWMASGTIPAIVYYGIKYLNPKLFVLCAFLISCFVSFLLGTSFGTASTIGIALMVMARAGGVNTNAVAGAVIAGAYFGDRCSPVSSSANLVAFSTGTELYTNIKNMFKTSIVPMTVSIIFYLIISFIFPMTFHGNTMELEISKAFNINPVVMLPALIILVFSLFKVNVKTSMLTSIIVAAAIAMLLQHNTLKDTIYQAVLGYKLTDDSPLRTIIVGGGIISMLKVSIVVFISSAFAGIFEGTGILKSTESLIGRARNRFELYVATTIVSIAAAAFGCTQALAIILTDQLVKNTYGNRRVSNEELALDIENTAVVISPLIPWNIAGLAPATTLMVGIGFIPFAFYLYLMAIYNGLTLKFKRR